MTSSMNCIRVCSNLLAALLIAFLAAGCATIKNGGAPEPAFNYDKDLKDLEDMFAPAASIAAMGPHPTQEARNNFIDGRLALYNIRYVRFLRDLGVDKQHLDAGTDALLLALNLAGAATGATHAKTNLALIAAGVTGGKVTIDKYFYFDKTIPALVSTMNAQRNLVLIDILKGRAKPVDEYPLTRVLTDLSRYEQAGTLIGAIDALQADASNNEKETAHEVRTLVVPTPAEAAEVRKLGRALASLREPTDANLAKINLILTKRKGTTIDIKDFLEARRTLSNEFRADDDPANLPLWREAIKSAGVTIDQ